MPRLKAVDPATDSGPGADILNGPLKEKQLNIFKGMATNPGALGAFLGFAGGIKAGALTEKEHEVIALTCAQKRNCDYCQAAHTMIAQGAGFDEETVLSIRRGTVDDDRHQALIDFTSAILDTNGFVSDQQFEEFMNAGYEDDAVLEVIGGIAVNTITNFFNHVHETEIDFPVAATV